MFSVSREKEAINERKGVVLQEKNAGGAEGVVKVLGRFQRDSLSENWIAHTIYQGKSFLDIRVYKRNLASKFVPMRQGISVPLEQTARLLKLIKKHRGYIEKEIERPEAPASSISAAEAAASPGAEKPLHPRPGVPFKTRLVLEENNYNDIPGWRLWIKGVYWRKRDQKEVEFKTWRVWSWKACDEVELIPILEDAVGYVKKFIKAEKKRNERFISESVTAGIAGEVGPAQDSRSSRLAADSREDGLVPERGERRPGEAKEKEGGI